MFPFAVNGRVLTHMGLPIRAAVVDLVLRAGAAAARAEGLLRLTRVLDAVSCGAPILREQVINSQVRGDSIARPVIRSGEFRSAC